MDEGKTEKLSLERIKVFEPGRKGHALGRGEAAKRCIKRACQ